MQAQESLRYEQSPLRIDYSEKGLIRMNLNENLVLPQNTIRSALVKCVDRLDPRYYPPEMEEGEIRTLRSEIARYCSCSISSVAIGVGSDQVIDMLFRAKLKGKSDKLVTVDPTFSMYQLFANRLGRDTELVRTRRSNDPRGPFSLDSKKIDAACKSKDTRILALASPNNPTGIQYPLQEIERLLKTFPDITLMLDEAYTEYGEYSATRILRSYPNLVIARTFSKAFGLASFRLGYHISSDVEAIQEINNELQYPYPITTLSATMAIEMLRRKDIILEYAEKTKTLRRELIGAIMALRKKLRVISPSNTNFLLVQSPTARRIAEDLLANYAIAVKYLPKLGDEKEFLRITVGTREMNQKLLYALRRVAS